MQSDYLRRQPLPDERITQDEIRHYQALIENERQAKREREAFARQLLEKLDIGVPMERGTLILRHESPKKEISEASAKVFFALRGHPNVPIRFPEDPELIVKTALPNWPTPLWTLPRLTPYEVQAREMRRTQQTLLRPVIAKRPKPVTRRDALLSAER